MSRNSRVEPCVGDIDGDRIYVKDTGWILFGFPNCPRGYEEEMEYLAKKGYTFRGIMKQLHELKELMEEL